MNSRALINRVVAASILVLLMVLVIVEGAIPDVAQFNGEDFKAFVMTAAVRANPDGYRLQFRAYFSCTPKKASTLLEYNSKLQKAANVHSRNMASYSNCFSHDSCNCQGYSCSYSARVKQYGYNGLAAENIVMNPSGAEKMMDQWLKSSGHCQNIFDTSYGEVGLSVSGAYGTMDLGNGYSTGADMMYGVFVDAHRLFIAVSNLDGKVEVIVDGQKSDMTANSGYYYAAKSLASCTEYYFQQGSKRFPATGSLMTDCNSLWTPQRREYIAPPPLPSPTPSPIVSTTLAMQTPTVELYAMPAPVNPTIVIKNSDRDDIEESPANEYGTTSTDLADTSSKTKLSGAFFGATFTILVVALAMYTLKPKQASKLLPLQSSKSSNLRRDSTDLEQGYNRPIASPRVSSLTSPVPLSRTSSLGDSTIQSPSSDYANYYRRHSFTRMSNADNVSELAPQRRYSFSIGLLEPSPVSPTNSSTPFFP